MNKGFFIVLEGPDRSGKSTQAALLKDWLLNLGYEVVLTREPGGTSVSEKVREILLDPKGNVAPKTELFLFATSRMQHTLEIIKPALLAGKIVISDRFIMSTEAYQGYGRGLPLNEIKIINKIATEGLKPDLTIVFNLPDEEFQKRIRNTDKAGGEDRIERESSLFRKRVADAYKLFSKNKGVKVIDASMPVAAIQNKLRLLIDKTIKAKCHSAK